MKQNWAVFISGRGSNLQALLDQAGEIEIRKVYSSRASAPGILRARRSGIPTEILPRQIDWTALNADLRKRGITHVFLAGFMKMVPAEFVTAWQGRILNVHPSLLPAYPGLHGFEKSYQDGYDLGVTVHEVTAEMDAGPILYQKSFWTQGQPKMSQAEAASCLSMTEQRLVREAVRRWK